MDRMSKCPIVKEIGEITSNMYRLGWNERNGGNISVLVDESEIKPYVNTKKVIRDLPLAVAFPEFAGKYFIVTGTGKYFKNVAKNPAENLGLIRIADDGSCAHLIWGYTAGGSYTSEIIMHLGAHKQRLNVDPNQRVVMHAHPVNILSMTHIFPWDEKKLTKELWSTCTECIVIFPDGVALLPWMVSSSPEIGLASAEKFKDFRILVWALHGCTVTGTSLDEAFGLLETVEKGAEIYMKIQNGGERHSIEDSMLKAVVDDFNIAVHEGWL